MKDTFTYGEGTDDGELLLQFSEEERSEFFHADGGVIEVMKKLNENVNEISKYSERSKQEIVDFLFSEPKEHVQSKVVMVTEEVQSLIEEIAEEPNRPSLEVGSSDEILGVAEESAIIEEQPEITAEPESAAEQEEMQNVILDNESQEELKKRFGPYDLIGILKENRRRVSKNGLYGFIDSDGKEIVKCVYESVNDYCEGIAVVCCDDGTYGYIDLNGKQITECKFLDALDFSEGLAAIKLNNKWGYIDKTGRLVIKYEYSDANSFQDSKAKVSIGRQEFEISRTGFRI